MFGVSLIACISAYGQNPEIIFLPAKEKTSYVIKSSGSKTPVDVVSDADGVINGHGYVDLGLPSGIKWANTNVGASTPDESGSYFGWGETRTKSDYSYANNATTDKNKTKLLAMGVIDNSGILTPSHDAAHVNWGGSWRMPTDKEFEELKENCQWTWIELNENFGWKVIGPNGNSIFIPAAGIYYGTYNGKDGDSGYYWSSSLSSMSDTDSVSFEFGCANSFVSSSDRRFGGQSIRAVSK